MFGDLYVRKAVPGDKQAIMKIARSLPEWFNKQGLEQIERSIYENDKLIAYKDGFPVGFAIYKAMHQTIELEWLAVAKDKQRQGIGTFLLNCLEGIGRNAGVEELELKTLGGDDYLPYVGTNLFYKNYGFSEISRVTRSLPEWPIEVVLKKYISATHKGDNNV